MVLYLNHQTFVGEVGERLADEVRSALGVLPIVLVHEQDPERHGCGFDRLLHWTPEDLISLGLYRKGAIACLAQPLRAVSLALIARALGAVPVEPLVKQVVRKASMLIRDSVAVTTTASSFRRSQAQAGPINVRRSTAQQSMRGAAPRRSTRTSSTASRLPDRPTAAPLASLSPPVEPTPREHVSYGASSPAQRISEERNEPCALADEEAQLAWAMRESTQHAQAGHVDRCNSSGSCMAMRI